MGFLWLFSRWIQIEEVDGFLVYYIWRLVCFSIQGRVGRGTLGPPSGPQLLSSSVSCSRAVVGAELVKSALDLRYWPLSASVACIGPSIGTVTALDGMPVLGTLPMQWSLAPSISRQKISGSGAADSHSLTRSREARHEAFPFGDTCAKSSGPIKCKGCFREGGGAQGSRMAGIRRGPLSIKRHGQKLNLGISTTPFALLP